MGKVAIALAVPILLVVAWWLVTQYSINPVEASVPTQAASQPSPSVPPAASPSVSQESVASATPIPTDWRPDYSADTRPAPSPEVFPSPSPQVLVQKSEYPATDLHWFVPSDAEMEPLGFVFFANRSERSNTGLFLNISDYYNNYTSDAKAQQFGGEGFLGMFSAECAFSNGTREFIPCTLQIISYETPALAASQVSYSAKPEVTGLGSAGVGEKSVLYRIDRASDPGRGTFYRVKFSRKNVFVSVNLPAIRADGSRLDALAIALLIDGKI